MAASKNNKHKLYVRYAAHCLNVAPVKEHDDEAIYREMALEWLRLADAVGRPLQPVK